MVTDLRGGGEQMKKALIIFFILFIITSLSAFSEIEGYLFIIGGGPRPETMMKKFIELAEKFNSGKIIIFPMASSVPYEVVGERNVIVYDASQAQVRISPSLSISGSDIVMHILSSGDRFSLKTKKVIR